MRIFIGVIINFDDWNIVVILVYLWIGFDIIDVEGRFVGKKFKKNGKDKFKGF